MGQELEQLYRYTNRIAGTIYIINDDSDLVKYLNKSLEYSRVLFPIVFELKNNIINFCNLLNHGNLDEYSQELLKKITEIMKIVIKDSKDDMELIRTAIGNLEWQYYHLIYKGDMEK